MAATSKGGRECVGRDANLLARRWAFDHRDGLIRRVHQDRYQDAADEAARLAPTVAGAWAGRGVVRWDAGRCRARFQEPVRDCRWASVAVEELGYVQPHQTRQLQGVRKLVACRRAQVDPLEKLHSWPDALPRVAPQEQRASWDAYGRVLEPQQAALEQPRELLALLPREKLAPLQTARVPLGAAPRAQQARHWGQLELFLEEQEPLRDELRADALQADGRQAHGLLERALRERARLGQPLRAHQVS